MIKKLLLCVCFIISFIPTSLLYLSDVHAEDPSLKPVFRFRNEDNNSHFFTIDEGEAWDLYDYYSYYRDWDYEDLAFSAFQYSSLGSVPVYRFYSDTFNTHFLTINEAEKDSIIKEKSDIWNYEGIAFNVYKENLVGSIPVYRFWSGKYQQHFYTTNENEKNEVINNYDDSEWKYEGIAFYSLKIEDEDKWKDYNYESEGFDISFMRYIISHMYDEEIIQSKYSCNNSEILHLRDYSIYEDKGVNFEIFLNDCNNNSEIKEKINNEYINIGSTTYTTLDNKQITVQGYRTTETNSLYNWNYIIYAEYQEGNQKVYFYTESSGLSTGKIIMEKFIETLSFKFPPEIPVTYQEFYKSTSIYEIKLTYPSTYFATSYSSNYICLGGAKFRDMTYIGSLDEDDYNVGIIDINNCSGNPTSLVPDYDEFYIHLKSGQTIQVNTYYGLESNKDYGFKNNTVAALFGSYIDEKSNNLIEFRWEIPNWDEYEQSKAKFISIIETVDINFY